MTQVWVTKKNLSKKLEEIPIPFSDVKNILEEIRFKDDATRKRCRGWLVLPSRRYLQADILFPGCEFDCRLTIRGRADSALVTDYVPNEESRQALSRYLSHFALTDEDDLVLRQPEMDIPEGFHLIHNRCSKRCLYEMSPGFAVILSEESSWNSNKRTEESRKTTDLHLHCKEWDELLNSGDWEPEEIVQRIPEFFRFVQKVQSFVLREMRSKTDKE